MGCDKRGLKARRAGAVAPGCHAAPSRSLLARSAHAPLLLEKHLGAPGTACLLLIGMWMDVATHGGPMGQLSWRSLHCHMGPFAALKSCAVLVQVAVRLHMWAGLSVVVGGPGVGCLTVQLPIVRTTVCTLPCSRGASHTGIKDGPGRHAGA